jgi:hypothetical protein
MERMSGHLVNHLCNLAQNRSRGKRRLAESYDSLVELSAEAAALDSHFVERLGKPVEFFRMTAMTLQTLTLDTMLQIVCSGFELNLYRMEECSSAYWLAVRISDERLDVVREILQAVRARKEVDVKVEARLESQVHYFQAIGSTSKAMHFLFNTPSFVRDRSTLPWQPLFDDQEALSGAQRPEHAAASATATTTSSPATSAMQAESIDLLRKVVFFKRFKWLKGKSRPEGLQILDNLWTDFKADAKLMQTKTVSRTGWDIEIL